MIYRRVLRYYRPFLGPTIVGLVLSLIGIGVNLLKPWPLQIHRRPDSSSPTPHFARPIRIGGVSFPCSVSRSLGCNWCGEFSIF